MKTALVLGVVYLSVVVGPPLVAHLCDRLDAVRERWGSR